MLAGLAGCAAPGSPLPEPGQVQASWRHLELPGKAATRYVDQVKDGRPAVHAFADRSASLWQRQLSVSPVELGSFEFSWWVPALIEGADLAVADKADSPVRIVLAFGGDTNKLSARNRMLFEVAHTLTGRPPPYATLMYVWANDAPVGSVIASARSDRIRKIVVESGPRKLGHWCAYRRDLVADFKLAFGEDPGPLLGVAYMTDADNTASQAEAWYGSVVLPP